MASEPPHARLGAIRILVEISRSFVNQVCWLFQKIFILREHRETRRLARYVFLCLSAA
jgi:hypothetical protein